MGETIHREVNKQVGLFLHEMTRSHPQEWPQLLDLIHFVMMTTPIQESGLCPRDLDRNWSMRHHVERMLVKLDQGEQMTGVGCARKSFENYRYVRSKLTGYLHSEALKRADAFDQGLHPKEWAIGDRVCRKESRGVLSKFMPRNSGPYVIGQILNKHKVIL